MYMIRELFIVMGSKYSIYMLKKLIYMPFSITKISFLWKYFQEYILSVSINVNKDAIYFAKLLSPTF